MIFLLGMTQRCITMVKVSHCGLPFHPISNWFLDDELINYSYFVVMGICSFPEDLKCLLCIFSLLTGHLYIQNNRGWSSSQGWQTKSWGPSHICEYWVRLHSKCHQCDCNVFVFFMHLIYLKLIVQISVRCSVYNSEVISLICLVYEADDVDCR